MDPSSNVSVSFDPSEIEAILNQSGQKTSPLQSVVPQPQVTQQEPEVAAQLAPQPQVSPFGSLSTLASNALDYITPKIASLDDISNTLQSLPQDITRFLTNPQAFTQSTTGQNPLPQETGFAASFSGLPAKNPNSLFTPQGMAYQEGYETGEPYGIAAQMAPFLAPIAKPLAQEAANRALMGESLMPKQMQGFLPEVQALGIIQGEKSKLWNPESAAKYEASEATDPRQAYLESGTYRWYDNKLRQMLSDKDAKVNFKLGDVNRDDLTLKDIYEHPTVYKAYPHLADVPVKFMTLPERYEGGYLPSTNEILINTNRATPNKIEELLPHEIDHAIQHHEGMQTGTSEKAFPTANEIFIAQHLEDLMSSADINAQKAAAFFEKQYGIKPSAAAIRYANSGQAYIMHSTSPFTRYRHAAGEVEADLSTYLRNKSQEELNKIYPYDVIPDIHAEGKINPSQIIVRRGSDAKGNPIFEPASGRRTPTLQEMRAALAKQQEINLSATDPRAGFKELANQAKADLEKAKANEPRTLEQRMKDQAELEDLKKPSVDEMKAAIALNNPDINWSVKEKGGNWPESWLDNNVKRLKNNIPEFDTSKPFTQEQGNYIRYNYPDVATDYDIFYNETKQHHMRYGDDMWEWLASSEPKLYNDLVNKTTLNHALNNWVDNRLKPYLKNDLATPGDPVRKLADEHGISHIKDLEDSQQLSRDSVAARERNKMPTEGHATTPAGRAWENLADTTIHPLPAKDFIGDYLATATQNPGLIEAATRDPNTKIHQLGSDFDTRLGLDHLMDELRSSLTGNVPQHLALTPKTLERMTMADAVRHVAKVNDYREKQMAKTAAEDMKDFPPIKSYANGDKWHDLKLPTLSEKASQELKDDPLFGIPQQVRNSWDRNITRDLEVRGFDDSESEDYRHAYMAREQELAQDYYSRNPKIHHEAYTKLDKMLKNEGDMMGHCVGCYTDEVASGNTKIFTLRDKSNKPHTTVEMNVVAPRWDELPTEVQGLPTEELNQWIKDNPTVVLNQFKGKQNKPIIEKYRDQALDLLNNPQNIHTIISITDEGRHDLAGAGIIDRNDTKSVMNTLLSPSTDIKGNRMKAYNQVLAQKPDLPRFMSDKEFRQLFENQKPKGHKHGGRIRMAEGGDPVLPEMDYVEEKHHTPFNPPVIPYAAPGVSGATYRQGFPIDKDSAVSVMADVSRSQNPGGTNYNINEIGGGYNHKVGPGSINVTGSHRMGTNDNRINVMYAIPMANGGDVNIDQMKFELAMRK